MWPVSAKPAAVHTYLCKYIICTEHAQVDLQVQTGRKTGRNGDGIWIFFELLF